MVLSPSPAGRREHQREAPRAQHARRALNDAQWPLLPGAHQALHHRLKAEQRFKPAAAGQLRARPPLPPLSYRHAQLGLGMRFPFMFCACSAAAALTVTMPLRARMTVGICLSPTLALVSTDMSS